MLKSLKTNITTLPLPQLLTLIEEESNNDEEIKMMTPMIIDHDNHDNTNGRNAIENRASLTDNNNTDANNMVKIALSSLFDEDNNKIQE